ncbi:hypothetical protein [Agrobacterium sp. B1(2019)]|uniref:hypothetical protein n=1 Tax=Agrobacterium sp. B1(2019) TaxID=2607032 RepID=UPI0011EE8F84|nr:hypothetical protein [Agrobacterium sp. B1(2019)]TZG37065.1 hypothetical protein AGR1_06305 [Agrobacterium sp. B1(2019)]
MINPIVRVIQGAIVNLCFSDPATGAKLGRLKLQANMNIRTALKVDGDVLHYSREHVKSLTTAELKDALAKAVGG